MKDNETTKILGFPQGLDNLTPETQVPLGTRGPDGKVHGALRVAENVDIDDLGKISQREGFVLVSALPGLHSLWATTDFELALGVYDGSLVTFDSFLEHTAVASLSAPLEPISYAYTAGWVYYSNGFDSGRVNAAGRRQEWALMPPLDVPDLAENTAAGGLAAGTYQVCITFLDADGRESGASEPVELTVDAGSGVLLTGIPQPIDGTVTTIRVYASPTNAENLYAVVDLPAGTATFLLGPGPQGKPLETLFDEPLPAGQLIGVHNSRLFVFRSKALYWSNPLQPGQGRLSKSYMKFGHAGTLLESVGQGPDAVLYIGAGERTYQLSGAAPDSWVRKIAHPHGAVPGSATRVDQKYLGKDGGEVLPYWLDTGGQFVVGTLAGVETIHDDRFAALTGVTRASTALRSVGGARRLISVLHGGTVNSMALGDRVEAEIWRDGVRIS